MQAGDLGDLLDPAMSQPHGFTTGDPTPLLFIKAIQQSIELPMFVDGGTFPTLATRCATTLMAPFPCHCSPTFPWDGKQTTRLPHFTK